MACELCGRNSVECKPASIDGVRMMLCPQCLRHGTKISITTPKAKKPKKDIYDEMKMELIPNWFEVIKKARIKKGLTREDLSFRIGERVGTISKIENGHLRPSDKIIAKLEKELGISLLEEVKQVSLEHEAPATMTLGDFMKKE
jgi:putative transcription factor